MHNEEFQQQSMRRNQRNTVHQLILSFLIKIYMYTKKILKCKIPTYPEKKIIIIMALNKTYFKTLIQFPSLFYIYHTSCI